MRDVVREFSDRRHRDSEKQEAQEAGDRDDDLPEAVGRSPERMDQDRGQDEPGHDLDDVQRPIRSHALEHAK
jgi:hypothetical protein